MDYKEYTEDGTNPSNLQVDFIDKESYETIHENTVILCHDVFITCTFNNQKGILLVKRLNHPAKDVFWPIGGRILRGAPTLESLQKKALDECSLKLTNIEYLGTARTLFKEDPFGHNKGTDTLNLVYTAESIGNLHLNKDHAEPLLVTKESYPSLRQTFDPYVQTYLDHINTHNLW